MAGQLVSLIKDSSLLLVTHNMGFAKRIAGKVAMIADGRIIETGTGEHAFDQLVSQSSRDFLAKVLKYYPPFLATLTGTRFS